MIHLKEVRLNAVRFLVDGKKVLLSKEDAALLLVPLLKEIVEKLKISSDGDLYFSENCSYQSNLIRELLEMCALYHYCTNRLLIGVRNSIIDNKLSLKDTIANIEALEIKPIEAISGLFKPIKEQAEKLPNGIKTNSLSRLKSFLQEVIYEYNLTLDSTRLIEMFLYLRKGEIANGNVRFHFEILPKGESEYIYNISVSEI